MKKIRDEIFRVAFHFKEGTASEADLYEAIDAGIEQATGDKPNIIHVPPSLSDNRKLTQSYDLTTHMIVL